MKKAKETYNISDFGELYILQCTFGAIAKFNDDLPNFVMDEDETDANKIKKLKKYNDLRNAINGVVNGFLRNNDNVPDSV